MAIGRDKRLNAMTYKVTFDCQIKYYLIKHAIGFRVVAQLDSGYKDSTHAQIYGDAPILFVC